MLISPDWIGSARLRYIYSVSSCVSENFADYINFWKHNGYWFFDSPQIIQTLADQHDIDLSGAKLFYYEVHDRQFDDKANLWVAFQPERSFTTQIITPAAKIPEGFDVVTFSCGTIAECSPLSCNSLAAEVKTNAHCLLDSLETAEHLLASGQFTHFEPGPFRIFAVYSVDWP
jgi:hypothetical protein